jgi:hypothetical protein
MFNNFAAAAGDLVCDKSVFEIDLADWLIGVKEKESTIEEDGQALPTIQVKYMDDD